MLIHTDGKEVHAFSLEACETDPEAWAFLVAALREVREAIPARGIFGRHKVTDALLHAEGLACSGCRQLYRTDVRPLTGILVIKGEDITIYGDGSQTRSFCYVDDLIEAMLRMMDTSSDVTGPVNIGNPDEFTMLELAEKVLRLTGSKSRLVRQPLPQDDPRQRQPDISLAKKMLDWSPRVSLDDGLVETIAYFKRLLSA